MSEEIETSYGPKYPEILYVKEVEEGEPEDNFFLTSADPADVSEPDVTIEIAEYRFVGTKKLTNETKFTD